MANLLDKASILLTPTAYDNGSMLSVKPTDGDGDFTFSRNSAATRVNAQGLVENVQILSGDLVQNGSFSQIGTEEVTNGNFSQEGSELVTNGDFSNGSTDWTLGTGWSIGTDKAISDGSSGSNNLRQSNILTIGSTYKITITVSDYVSGNVEASVGAVPRGTMSANGTYTFYQEATPTGNFYIIANNFIGSVTNVSVKEVGQDWSLGTGWSIGDSKVVGDGTSFSVISQTPISILNKKIKLTFDILDYVNGTFRLIPSDRQDGLDERFSGNGSYEVIYTSTVDVFRFQQQAFDGSITNISVKEVGQNWTFGDGFTPDQANSKATCDGTQSAVTNLTQTISTNIQNKLVRVSFTLDYTAGVLLGSLSGTGAVDFNNITSSGTYTAEMTSNEVNPPLILQGDTNFIGSITNIVLKEVTNDTNLPRINYEGFSYQDALGSELLTNGDFATNINGWGGNTTRTWNNGTLVSVGVGAGNNTNIQVGSILTAGKTYRFTWEILSTDGNASFVFTPSEGQITNSYVGAGTFTEDVTIVSNSNYVDFRFTGANTTTVFNSVSVKEVLGQEVVPDSGCGSWLLEDESTNLVPYSEDFSQWSNVSTTLTSGYLAPDGTLGATKISGTIGTSNIVLGGSSSTTATRTIYARTVSGTGTAKLMSFHQNTNNLFTLTEEWQRFELNGAISTGGTSSYIDFRDNSQTLSEFIIWGAQSEELTYATSYIPTSGATSTRLRDIASGSGNSTLINSTEGVLYAEIAALADDGSYRYISISDGTNSNYIVIRYYNITSKISAFLVNSSSTQGSTSFVSGDITSFTKVAYKWKVNDFALWVDGVEVSTQSSGSVFSGETLNSLAFTEGDGVGNYFYGKNKALAVYKEALTDAELTALTTI